MNEIRAVRGRYWDRPEPPPFVSGKKRLTCDFDGVLHSYPEGLAHGSNEIADPVPGAIEWLVEVVPRFDFWIHSTRCACAHRVQGMIDWLLRHGLSDATLAQIGFTPRKLPSWLHIDDRVFCFRGLFPTAKEIRDFKPWNR